MGNSGVLCRVYCHVRPILVSLVMDIGCRAIVRHRTPLPLFFF